MEENIGAFVCDEGVFNRILRLEKRRGDHFLFIAISFENKPKELILKSVFEDLIHLLRTKDVISKTINNQILLLLNNASICYGEDIVSRLKKLFKENYPDLKPVFSPKNF
jgi:hypothetical protein